MNKALSLYNNNNIIALKIIVDVCNKKFDQKTFLRAKIKELSHLVFQISKEGKVLSAFCDVIDLFPENFQPYLKKRLELTRLYLKYLKVISEELNHGGIEYYVFKTTKPFLYDMTDIDILFVDKISMLKALKIITQKLGFKIISKGTHSLTLRRTINNFDIDVDLQPEIFAGTFNYISVSEMRKTINELGYFKENICFLRPELELAVVAGHAIFKDFAISLANILYADYLLKVSEGQLLSLILKHNPHLIKPVEIIYDVVNVFKAIIVSNLDTNLINQKNVLNATMIHQLSIGKGNFTIPFIVSIEAYLKAFLMSMESHNYKGLLEIVSLPRSRGVKILFRRLNLLPPDEDVIEA